MAEIIPAILEKNFGEIKNKLTFLRARAKCVQLDICDGVFVPNQTWPFYSGGFEDADFLKILNEEEDCSTKYLIQLQKKRKILLKAQKNLAPYIVGFN